MVADSEYEVGGVLLGHKFADCYIILVATASQKGQMDTKTTFVLDGEYHTQAARSLIERFFVRPLVIGVWHSHICDDVVFSEQDQVSNKQFSQLCNGAVSVLVTLRQNRVNWASYHITTEGTSHLCRTIVNKHIKRKEQANGRKKQMQ